MFVTNWISTTKIQKISEITNFFRHYFLSRTEVKIRFLSEKAKSFSIFLQITEVLQMEIGAQKKEMKQNLRCFISFYMISYSVSYCIS